MTATLLYYCLTFEGIMHVILLMQFAIHNFVHHISMIMIDVIL